MSLPLLLVTRPLDPDRRRRILAACHGRLRLLVLDEGHDRLPKTAQERGRVEVACGWIPPDRLPELPNLRWLHIPWTGVDAILTAQTLRPDTLLTCTKGHLSDAIAEHVLASLLHIARDFGSFAAASRQGRWLKNPQVSLLAESRILVLGTGHIGRTVARLLRKLRVHTDGLNTDGHPVPGFDRILTRKDLPRRLKDYDAVVNTLPYTAATDGFCDRDFFNAMRRGAGFVNIGRGGTVSEADLVEAVLSGRLKGAVLDVTRQEPLPKTSPLFYHPRILVTAHSAGAPWTGADKGLDLFIENLPHYLAGKPRRMRFLVDPKKGY